MDVKRLKEILSEMPDDAKVVYGLPDGGEEVRGFDYNWITEQ